MLKSHYFTGISIIIFGKYKQLKNFWSKKPQLESKQKKRTKHFLFFEFDFFQFMYLKAFLSPNLDCSPVIEIERTVPDLCRCCQVCNSSQGLKSKWKVERNESLFGSLVDHLLIMMSLAQDAIYLI